MVFYFINIDDLSTSHKSKVIIFALLIIAYSFAGVRLINCAFDRSAGQVYKPRITDKKTSERWEEYSNKKVYYLLLTEWGPRKETEKIEVNSDLYNEVRIGDSIHITINPGLLNIPWFVISR